MYDFVPELLVVSNPLWETTLLFDSLPEQVQVQERGLIPFLSDAVAVREDTGGSAANVAVHAAQWGFEVAQVGRTGTDLFSDKARKRLLSYGVHDALVEEDGRRLKTSAIVRKLGRDEGYFCAWIPERAVTPVRWEDIPEGWILSAKWVHLDRVSELGLHIARTRFEAGLGTSLDLHICPHRPAAQERLEAMLPCVDLLQLSASGMESLCARRNLPAEPEALLPQLYRPGQWLTVTLGHDGACSYKGDGQFIVEPAHLETGYVDATGAGDAFVAMMIRHRMAGSSLEMALGEAGKYAAVTCQGLGALSQFG